MKTIGFLVFFITLTALAQNPLIRVCNTTGGQFHEIYFSDDQVGFCQYELAMIDSETMLQSASFGVPSLAVEALFSSSDTCALADGDLKQGVDATNAQFYFCEFRDGSMIELSTLKAGSDSPSNSKLVDALSIRF